MFIVPTTDYQMSLARPSSSGLRTVMFPICEDESDPRPEWMHRPRVVADISYSEYKSREKLDFLETDIAENPGTWCVLALNTPRKLQYERQARIAVAAWELGQIPEGCRYALVFWLGDSACPTSVLKRIRAIVEENSIPIVLDEARLFVPPKFPEPIMRDARFKYFQRESKIVYSGPVDDDIAAMYAFDARHSWIGQLSWLLPCSLEPVYGKTPKEEYDNLFSLITCRQFALDEMFPLPPAEHVRVARNYTDCPIEFAVNGNDPRIAGIAENKRKFSQIAKLWKAHWEKASIMEAGEIWNRDSETILRRASEQLGMPAKIRAMLDYDIPIPDLVG